MRPVIVNALNEYFHTTIFAWLVPELLVVYLAAIVLCAWLFLRRAREAGLSAYHAWGAALCASVAGMLGVRAWYLLMHVGLVRQDPSMLWDFNGATVSFGGYVFGFAAFVGYLIATKQRPMPYLDAVASCLACGPMLGRIACFLNGDDYGTITSMPWGVRFPPGSYVFADHVNRGAINIMATASLPVHPVQLYFSISALLLFIICTHIWRTQRSYPGTTFCLFWILYALQRFALEFYRGDSDVRYWGSLTYGQAACAVIFAVAVVAHVTLRRREARHMQFMVINYSSNGVTHEIVQS